jgi:hypothetical protein
VSKLLPHQRVASEEAKRRALSFLARQGVRSLSIPSQVGSAIWPDNNMWPQGLAFAASKLLSNLEDDGLVQWQSNQVGKYKDWGYVITQTGRKWVKDNA